MTMDINISLYLPINFTLRICFIFSMLNFKVHFKSNNLFLLAQVIMVIKLKFNTINFELKNEIMNFFIEMNRFEQVAKFNKDISKKKPLFS